MTTPASTAAEGVPTPAPARPPALAAPAHAVGGTVAAGFEPVRDAFERVIATAAGTGAAVAAWHDGSWIVDLWGGAADAAGTTAWGRDSIVMPYSVTKPFAAVCALLLVDGGQLDLDAQVRRYWPGFAAPATVRHVLAHQAGLVALDRALPTEALFDWELICATLAAQQPLWTPGTAHGESALFYGHLVGELVRRVDGRTLGQFLREEVSGPLGLDFTIGLGPAEQARAVEITGLDAAFREGLLAGRPDLYPRAIGNPPGIQDGAVVNSAALRAAEIPAVNGHGTARAVAGLYAALLSGRLLRQDLLAEASTAQCSGPDRVMGGPNAWGLGFGVDEDGFGMGGLGGSIGWASQAGHYAYAFVTGSMGDHSRADAVENALRDCLGLPPLAS
ncbi:beta-lactamase family protein [Frankia sp. CNm7]|uniref:Beta-lactamase family protein n=1 Tax=Frankia nepalensis TaxID=1836974 RepID=A0A937RP51_9ACTN|nr:serine hydrolase domain-containing protein [Frankia nepalensis]MBL7498491.1 beta-lactamase family protein [Frankia nepalensis]MBL7509655.1 beta-lactamase family protein [Frankia nepalensis]MBL7524545.1 beta-lactamase family protein [Frankia nepalensis]MBL7630849.1 beta-lactamase family protein [Frankia nepalensis]